MNGGFGKGIKPYSGVQGDWKGGGALFRGAGENSPL